MKSEIAKLIGIVAVMVFLFIPIFLTSKYGMLVGWLSMVSMLFVFHFLLDDK